MSATSVTGTGPGDSHKRIAYLSRDLPKYEFTKTTTDDQDLITGEVPEGEGSEGCGCDFNTQWELMYSRSTENNDGIPQPTGITFDPLYEWAFGIRIEIDNAMVFSLFPVTTPVLRQVLNLNTNSTDFIGIIWSPDGTNDFNFSFNGDECSFLNMGAMLSATTIQMLYNNGSTIEYDGAGSFGPAGDFVTFFQNEFNDGYFVIARRRIVPL